MGEHVVGDEEGARLDLGPGELEEPFVVVLLGVDEDDIEDVIDLREGLEGVAFDQLGRLFQPGLGDVSAPGLGLQRIGLE